MPSFKDLTGKRFGRLVAWSRARKGVGVHWECICDCGIQKIVAANKLTSGHTKSCGCLQKERAREANLKHGHSSYPNGGNPTKEYNTWCMMRRRCEDPKDSSFHLYGGRGVSVCDRWKSFEYFLSDMGHAPTKSHSIDRIDNNGDYDPSNCKWSDAKSQVRNRRNTVFVTYRGETKPLGEWAEITGIAYKLLHARLKKGWSVDRVMSKTLRQIRQG